MLTADSVSPPLAQRLAEERVIWITTVTGRGAPVPTPIWFLWVEDKVLVLSQPDTPKLRNLRANPRVALNLNSDAEGGAVAVLRGTADLDGSVSTEQWDAYVAKYRDAMTRLDYTPESFRADYSHPVWIEPDSLRSW